MNKGYVKLDKVKVNNNRIEYLFTPSENLKKFFNMTNKMFIEFDENIQGISDSILVIPFVANIMPLMWLTDSVLWINEIDREYYDSLGRIKLEYQNMYPDYRFGGVLVAAKTIYNKYEAEIPAVQLFSGGLDSITTTIRSEKYRPILVNIQGWYEGEITDNVVFDSDRQNILKFSEKNNLKSMFVKSNFATIIISEKVNKSYNKKLGDAWWHGLQHGMAFIGHAIPIAYKYRAENIYIASSNSLGGRRITCSSDPAVDIQVKYASGGVIHDGAELTRQEKIRVVIEKQKKIGGEYPLRVCSFNDRNCCCCDKCFRTILGLVAEGVDIKLFDFNIEGSLKSHFIKIMELKLHLMGIEQEASIYWLDIKNRMIENMDNIKDIEQLEFIKWFLEYDFIKNRKKAILNYRIRNIVPIIKRKLAVK